MSSEYIRSLREKRYSGSKTSLVIGIDLGTTFSGVSYAILRPGEAPKILPVSRFSDQTLSNGKIPTVIYYDDHGIAKAIGASTTKAMVIREAEQKGWIKAEYFKMHFRPSGQQIETHGLELGDPPLGKSAEQVMADFLHYLLRETENYITNAHTAQLWSQVKDDAIFVLGHPNGWSGHSQQRYRASAILGGLVPDTEEGRKRIKFVSEGEASALACLSGGLASDSTLKKGFRFIIADAGGGTIDTTTFEVLGVAPLQLKECATADCRFAGSIFVNMHARSHLRRKLRNSKYDDKETLDTLIGEDFEQRTKREFTGNDDGLLQIGERREHDQALGIARGYLFLQREDLAKFFKHSVSQIVQSIRGQLSASGSDQRKTPVWLVGGFGSSAYLLREIRRAFEQDGMTVQTPDTNLSKAVANGAVLHYIDEMVVARVCRTTYGTDCYTDFNPLRSEHRSRPELVKQQMSGRVIGPIFHAIAEKGTSIDVGKTVSSSYSQRFISKEKAAHYTTELLSYDGNLPAPYWYDENKEKFRVICKLEADLSHLCREGHDPSSFLGALLFPVFGIGWYVHFEIELKFGTTEVEARLKWEENGDVKYGPVKTDWLE